MENGYDAKLAEKFSGMKLGLGLGSSTGDPTSDDNNNSNNANNPNDSSLFQVMKAVEAAEATIKQQVDENNRLRVELQNKDLLIQKYVSFRLRILAILKFKIWFYVIILIVFFKKKKKKIGLLLT